jgi:polynucleotide 5'-hydroxyl-kinase GRC3/NOL9
VIPAESNVLQMLTPVPPSLLTSSAPRVLVKGEVELPVWGMLDPDEEEGGKEVPFLRWGKGEGAGAEKRRVRRNLMRRGQM